RSTFDSPSGADLVVPIIGVYDLCAIGLLGLCDLGITQTYIVDHDIPRLFGCRISTTAVAVVMGDRQEARQLHNALFDTLQVLSDPRGNLRQPFSVKRVLSDMVLIQSIESVREDSCHASQSSC